MTDTTDDIAEEISFQAFDDDCHLLGNLLNDCLTREVGPQFTEKVERVRLLAQSACNMRMAGVTNAAEMLSNQLEEEVSSMELEEAAPLARTFSAYLNLMGIAETHHRVRRTKLPGHMSKSCDDVFNRLIQSGVSQEDLYKAVCEQDVGIVLTAHPTQINRRTIQYKFLRIAHLLERNDRTDLTHEDRDLLIEDLVREITSLWQTDELRRRKPTPVDEARGGLHIVEQSLWKAVPHYLRRVSNALKKHTGKPLPLTSTPIKFGSWMGGDRDGNPNVTAKVTRDVSYLARWIAADLYLREVDGLRFELSMSSCSDKLARIAYLILTREQQQHEDHHHHDSWFDQRQKKHSGDGEIPGHPLPSHLPFGADIPGFTGNANDGEAEMPILELPVTDAFQASSIADTISFGMVSKEGSPTASMSDAQGLGLTLRSLSLASPQSSPVLSSTPPTPTSARGLELARSGSFKKKNATESNLKTSSVDKLLHPSLRGRPDIAPYRIVLSHVREKLVNTRRRMEMLLEGLTCDYEDDEYYELTEELLEPLLMCHESMV